MEIVRTPFKTFERLNRAGGRIYIDQDTKHEYPSVTSIIGNGHPESPNLAMWKVNQGNDYIVTEVVKAFVYGTTPDLTGLTNTQKAVKVKKWIKKITARAKTAHKDVSKVAMDKGSYIHEVMEMKLKGEDIAPYLQADPTLTPLIVSVDKWLKEHQIDPVQVNGEPMVEATLYSDQYAFAGTVDLVAWQKTPNSQFGREMAIIDIKTGKGVYDTYKLQLAAYAHAFAEMTGYHPNVGYVLHLDLEKGGLSPELKLNYNGFEKEFNAFKHIRQTYQRLFPTNYRGYT